MIKSLDSAVSAIKAQQTKLDVTANNIANVNTVGFKKSRTVFSTLLNSTIRTASGATETKGGMNPSTIGLGVQVSAIDTVHTQGILSSTGRALDLAMQGEGFFTVTDGSNTYYTRNGGVNMSPLDGSLCLANGMRVIGYPIDANGNIDKSTGLSPITLPTGTDVVVQATSKVDFTGNISSSAAIGDVVTIPFTTYDSLGTAHKFSMTLTMTATGADWEITHADGLAVTNGTGSLSFGPNGEILPATITGGPVSINPVGAEPLELELDFSNVTRVDKSTDFSMKSQNGMPAGTVQSVSVTNGGVVCVSYSNGMSKEIASLGIALFDNPAGLLAGEDSLFTATQNSGEAVMVGAGESAKANVVSGFLEGSNVDVSEELTEMIKTQRAYQMATKVVTTSDEILQELTNIKR